VGWADLAPAPAYGVCNVNVSRAHPSGSPSQLPTGTPCSSAAPYTCPLRLAPCPWLPPTCNSLPFPLHTCTHPWPVSPIPQSTIATLNSGDYFGELGLVRGRARSATITSLEYSELLWVTGAEFKVCAVRVLCVCCACWKGASVRPQRGCICCTRRGRCACWGLCTPIPLTHSLTCSPHSYPTHPPTHPNTHALYQDTGLLAYFQEQLQWRKSTLQRIHLFDNLAEDTLEDLASSFRVCHADQGTILQVQGAVPQRVCILTKGVAKVGKCVCLGGWGGSVLLPCLEV
jgi:hypothetical protein